MFENLSDRLQGIAHKIKGYGKITEDNISDMMREIRLSLLEADVNYNVCKNRNARKKITRDPRIKPMLIFLASKTSSTI